MFTLFFAEVSIFARPPFNMYRASLRYIRTLISAIFGCLTNALAPPPIALESCSTAQTDQPV